MSPLGATMTNSQSLKPYEWKNTIEQCKKKKRERFSIIRFYIIVSLSMENSTLYLRLAMIVLFMQLDWTLLVANTKRCSTRRSTRFAKHCTLKKTVQFLNVGKVRLFPQRLGRPAHIFLAPGKWKTCFWMALTTCFHLIFPEVKNGKRKFVC